MYGIHSAIGCPRTVSTRDLRPLWFWVLSFFSGFRIYRECRVLADTPEISIRGTSMGLVEIHGKAGGEQPVTSLLAKTPCFFDKVDVGATAIA